MILTNELKEEIVSAILPMEGWTSPEKAIAMAELIVKEKPKVVVELGVFGGRSVVPQAMALKHNGGGKVYGIDPWKKEFALEGSNDEKNNEWWGKLDLHYIHRLAQEAIWKHKLDEYAVYIRTSSHLCVDLFKSIDVLHCDGNHSELSSCRDIENYMPLVKPGGYIWFDDANWPTTQKALGMVKEQCEEIMEVNSGNICKLFRKMEKIS